MRLILASRNEHKLRELRRVLAGREGSGLDLQLDALPPEVELPPEEGESFAENAIAKARAARAATGEAVIADDSGIEAASLDGAPGVRSARFAGEDATDAENLALLLDQLRDESDRGVAYVCALAYAGRDGTEQLFEARCEGILALEPRGERGFGYDPAFIPAATGPDDERTMAELTDAEKDAVSHRGGAARLLAAHLGETLGAKA
jgi:XTP/dITP diphosphohydrolase